MLMNSAAGSIPSCQSGSHKLRNAKTVARELGAVGTNTPLAPIFQKVFIFCHAWFG
jgi:hypothetical protein